MKLLTKKSANSESTLLKSQQVKEGIHIAGKVDALRQELSSLEKQHKDFIVISRKGIQKELEPLYTKLENLKSEIKVAEERKTEALKPLTEEWKHLERVKETIKLEQADILIKSNNINEKEIEVNNKEEKINKLLKQTEDFKSQTERNCRVSLEFKEQAENILKESMRKRELQDKDYTEREKEIINQERRNEFDRQANENVIKDIQLIKKGQDEREKSIRDKYETLIRTINRIKK